MDFRCQLNVCLMDSSQDTHFNSLFSSLWPEEEEEEEIMHEEKKKGKSLPIRNVTTFLLKWCFVTQNLIIYNKIFHK